MQVQGKFKRLPNGEIYCGAEGTKRMELGMFGRSICKAILSFVGTMVSNTHYSFGMDPNDPDFENPHLVAPLFSSMDKIVITPPGEELPPLGVPFVEDLAFRKHRLKTKSVSECPINIENTYSMSVNTANLDLITWNVVGVPMMRPMDLRSIIGDCDVKLVAYELPKDVVKSFPDTHPQRRLNNVFSLAMSPIAPGNVVEVASEDEEGNEGGVGDVDVVGVGASDDDDDEEDANCDDEEDEEDVTVNPPDEDETFPDETIATFAPNRTSKRRSVLNFFKRKVNDLSIPAVSDVPECSGDYANRDMELESHGDAEYCPACIEIADNRRESRRRIIYMVPWDEPGDAGDGAANYGSGAGGNNKKLAGLTGLFKSSVYNTAASAASAVEGGEICKNMRFRPYSDFSRLLTASMPPIPKLHFNRRILLAEKRRRQVVQTMREHAQRKNESQVCTSATSQNIVRLLNPYREYDLKFLEGFKAVSKKSRAGSMSISAYEGYVCIAQSRRHWSQEYLIVDKTDLKLVRVPFSRRPSVILRVPMSSIIAVTTLSSSVFPFKKQFAFFEVETVHRVFTFLVGTEKHRQDWMQAFTFFLGKKIVDESSKYELIKGLSYDSSNLTHANTAESNLNSSGEHSKHNEHEKPYLARPTNCWKLRKRRILNYRRIVFNHPKQTGSSSDESSTKPASYSNNFGDKSPCELVESVLEKAFVLGKYMNNNSLTSNSAFFKSLTSPGGKFRTESFSGINQGDFSSIMPLWMRFLDGVSHLQTVDTSSLNPREKCCFFLNLYHLMVLHGSIVLGPPQSWAGWGSFFNTVTYLVGYDMISLIELEHNILRSCMSRPAGVLSKLSTPHANYPEFALTSRDFRLNFCINNGSCTMPDAVFIYKPDILDSQLDLVCICA